MRLGAMREGRTHRRAWLAGGLVLLLLAAQAAAVPAATMYTYEDDSGAVVMTDRLESVPERFRHQVRRIEQDARGGTGGSGGPFQALPRAGPPSRGAAPAAGRGSEATLTERFWSALPERIVPGLTQYQSVLLIGGFVLGSIVFATMTLTKNPGLRFAMKWALIFVAGGTLYGLYFAELGTNLSAKGEAVTDPRTVLDRVRTKARDIERVQQERLRGMERMGQIEDPAAGE